MGTSMPVLQNLCKTREMQKKYFAYPSLDSVHYTYPLTGAQVTTFLRHLMTGAFRLSKKCLVLIKLHIH